MRNKILLAATICSMMSMNLHAQDYETCSFSGEEAWAGDTAAITAFLISCGRIDTTSYDEHGKKTKGKPHHQTISMKLNNGKVLHNDSIYFIAEEMPSFPGGDEGMLKYFKDNVHYPAGAHASGTSGKVIISLIIERDGTLSHFKVVRGIGNGCDEEALRVLRNMPKWVSGKTHGKEVRVQMNLPVKFELKG